MSSAREPVQQLLRMLKDLRADFAEDAAARDGALRLSIATSVQAALRDAQASHVVELTRHAGSSASALRQREELLLHCDKLPEGVEGEQLLRELGHLPATGYLEQQLEVREHHLIRRLAPPFSNELKRRRLDEASGRGERPFIAWSCGDWRLVHFEEDRELMDTIFSEAALQAKLAFLRLASTPPGAAVERPALAGGSRAGPRGGGSSAHVSRAAIAELFGVSAP